MQKKINNNNSEHETSKKKNTYESRARENALQLKSNRARAQILSTHPNAQEAWLPIWNSNLSG